MKGILCINKPENFTSFDVVAKLRGMLKIKRIGHGGTLDPMATGVLPVFLGTATKACDIMPDSTKSYRAWFRLGINSDTQDITGNILTQSDMKADIESIKAVIPEFKGRILQIPPMYSAVQINGKRLYDLARQGIEIERKPRETEIYSISIADYNEEKREGILDISCSKGTYIRTIINDIGEKIGCGGVMTGLVRTSSCGFGLDDCFTLDEVQKAVDENRIEELILPVEKVFESMCKLKLNEVQTRMYRNGVKLDLSRIQNIRQDIQEYAVYGFDGLFIGTARAEHESGILRVSKNLA